MLGALSFGEQASRREVLYVGVAEWWLVGYESRQLNSTESDNDNIDAGDVGAGQSVTVLYELVLAGTIVW